MLIEDFMIENGPHPGIGGDRRIYRFPTGFGLSAINSRMAHAYPFAWEFAVLKDVQPNGKHGGITYDTPLTQDVVVCDSDDEANEFIRKAIAEIGTVKE